MLASRSFLFLIVLLLSSVGFAQESDEAKLKEHRQNLLVEQIISDVPNLRLGENRALVYAKVGSLIWNSDPKRSHNLFQNALGELINAQMAAESDPKKAAYQNDLLTGQSTRPAVLNAIASREAEFAIEMLAKTRPAAISKAMAMGPARGSKINNYSSNGNYLAQNEFNMEQTFARMAAEQSPERAAQLLRQSLTKGISNESLNLLKKLYEKEPSTANDLASQLVDKVMQSKFLVDDQPNYQNIQNAINFLNDSIRQRDPSERSFKFDDQQMQTLANKLISFFLESGSGQASYLGYSVVPIAEKFMPNAVEPLKSLAKKYQGRGEWGGYDPDVQKLLSSDKTPDQLVAEAKNYSVQSQRMIYQTAANKYVQQGDLARASSVLTDHFSDDALDELMQNLRTQWASTLVSQGKFSDAEVIIDDLPDSQRSYQYVNLANAIYQKDPKENKTYAMSVLAKARDVLGEKPATANEMSYLMQIVAAYINMEPSEAFGVFEPLVPQLNELADASVVISAFQGGSGVRDGEALISQGSGYGYYLDYSILGQLSQKDFDRTMTLIDAFRRRETRIMLKLQVAERFS